MASVKEAAATLETKLKELGLQVHKDPGATIRPPALLVSLPSLRWVGYCGSAPSDARFTVHLIAPFDEHALGRLQDMVMQVTEKVEEIPDAVIAPLDFGTATPGTISSGGSELPEYRLNVDFAL